MRDWPPFAGAGGRRVDHDGDDGNGDIDLRTGRCGTRFYHVSPPRRKAERFGAAMTAPANGAAMRASLAARLAGRPRRPTASGPSAGSAQDAAVLVPLIARADGMTILLTRRSERLDSHPGQIAFPGGRVDPGDRDAVDTALRETEEEVGLPRERIDVVGRLEDCWTGTGFRVAPVVGVVSEPFSLDELTLDDAEVAEAFETPLAFVMDPANHVRRTAVARGMRRRFHVLPWGDRYIWGATAHMLVDLSRALRSPA